MPFILWNRWNTEQLVRNSLKIVPQNGYTLQLVNSEPNRCWKIPIQLLFLQYVVYRIPSYSLWNNSLPSSWSLSTAAKKVPTYLCSYIFIYTSTYVYSTCTYLGCVVLVISTQKRYCTRNMADFRLYKPEERRTAGMSSHIKAV